MQITTSELISLGFFFAMRSCEFCMEKGERKIKIAAVGGTQFFYEKWHRLVETCSLLSGFLPHSLCKRMSIFGIQFLRNMLRIASWSVALAASLVWHILNAPGMNDDTPICCYHQNHKLMNMSQAQVLDCPRGTVVAIGEATLGLS